MPKIIQLKAEEIFDSRGVPTISVSCVLSSGSQALASVPSGKSKGKNEAFELRDGDPSYHSGLGVNKAINNINTEIFEILKDQELDQRALDDILIKLDASMNKSRLGANALLAVSLAFARVCAEDMGLELYEYLNQIYEDKTSAQNKSEYNIPEPAFNIINGGKHSDSGIAFQEFMLIPVGFGTIKEKVEVVSSIIDTLADLLQKDGYATSLGDEGGFAPKLNSNEDALKYLVFAIQESGYSTEQIKLGIDVASTSFYNGEKYEMEDRELSTEQMIELYEKLAKEYPLISIEDGLHEEDFENFTEMNKRLGRDMNIVGDDLTVTNVQLIKKAIEGNCINTVLIKPNQIGTLTETLEAIAEAQENNIKIFISHRSGETLDTFISDLAVAVGADFIKAGSLTKKERKVKYDRLIEIENILKTIED